MINWKEGKRVTSLKANGTMLVFLRKKGSKETFKMFSGIGQIICYENVDTSKFGCIKCGKPFDRKKNFINHWLKLHGKRPRFKKQMFSKPIPRMVK